MAEKTTRKLNALGIYLQKRSINKANVCRKTGIQPGRMTWICFESLDFLGAAELQLIALAINVDPAQMQKDLFGHLKLKEEATPSEKVFINITDVLSKKDLFEKHKLTVREIERIVEIIPFCNSPKTDDEIAEHIRLKRKSPKFISALKASVEAGWHTLQQTHKEGKVINTYTTTKEGLDVVNPWDQGEGTV